MNPEGVNKGPYQKIVSLPVWELFSIFGVLEREKTVREIKIRIGLMKEASEFIFSLPEKVQKKITYNLQRIERGEINSELFKKLENSEIWEFRTLYNEIHYRLFAFWDTEEKALIMATHGIIKKTQKTPRKEIARAEALRKEYFKNK